MKKVLSLLLFALCVVCISEPAKAQVGAYTKATVWEGENLEKMHIPVKHYRMDVIDHQLDKTETITSIKSSSKYLKVWKAHEIVNTLDERMIRVGVYAKKKGKYTVTYNIVDGNNEVVRNCKLEVLADNNKPFSYIKINGKNAKLNYKSNNLKVRLGTPKKVKGKYAFNIKVKMNKGFKLNAIYYDASETLLKTDYVSIKNAKTYYLKKTGVKIKIEYTDTFTGITRRLKEEIAL